MFLFDFFRSFLPLHNPIGFGAADFIELALALLLVSLVLLRANPSLCVVAASGYSMDTTAMEAAAPGRVAVLQKPFAPEMLAAAVRRMLAAQEETL